MAKKGVGSVGAFFNRQKMKKLLRSASKSDSHNQPIFTSSPSPDTLSAQTLAKTCLKSGWLLKLNRSSVSGDMKSPQSTKRTRMNSLLRRAHWKPRFFCLSESDAVLYWFESEIAQKPNGQVYLGAYNTITMDIQTKNAPASSPEQNGFPCLTLLSFGSAKPLMISGESEEELRAWMVTLKPLLGNANDRRAYEVQMQNWLNEQQQQQQSSSSPSPNSSGVKPFRAIRKRLSSLGTKAKTRLNMGGAARPPPSALSSGNVSPSSRPTSPTRKFNRHRSRSSGLIEAVHDTETTLFDPDADTLTISSTKNKDSLEVQDAKSIATRTSKRTLSKATSSLFGYKEDDLSADEMSELLVDKNQSTVPPKTSSLPSVWIVFLVSIIVGLAIVAMYNQHYEHTLQYQGSIPTLSQVEEWIQSTLDDARAYMF